MKNGTDAKGVPASKDNPKERLEAFLKSIQDLCWKYDVAIHGVNMQVHDHTALGVILSCQGETREFHWIAPSRTAEHGPNRVSTGYDSVMRHINIAHTSRSDKACRALTSAGFRFLVDFEVDNAINIANAELEGWEEAYANLWGKSNLDEGGKP